jgi:ATP-binding cassette subfamily C (CFTR/MRP) protein 1
LLPLTWLYLYVQEYYLKTSRELKRLDSISRSPIYAHFGETLSGVSSIRAYAREFDFVENNELQLDKNQKAYYASIVANRWLGIRLEFVGTCVVFLSALFVVLTAGSLNPGLAGLSITYSLQMTQLLSILVRFYTEVETQMVSVERMIQYSEVQTEAPPIIPENRPPPSWPNQGLIQFHDLKIRYREGLPLVLQGITMEIQPREKIGVVGRTGAGKSSLMLALFRLVEPAGGQIIIDGIDIATIGLDDLRSKLSIIPQDPTLFTGTIRSNLDPFSNHTDKELWDALEATHLKDAVREWEGQLDHVVTEYGENLSVGQRQLMCLGRAILRRSKVLVMDEATAAVDFETDSLIQTTIREQFKDMTVLTIAHRVNTILDYDRVLVLDKGVIAEFAKPADLLADPKSIFSSMVRQYGGGSTSANEQQ